MEHHINTVCARILPTTSRPTTARTWIEVSRERLIHNYTSLAGLLPRPVRCMVIVKSNANGHGAEAVCRVLDSIVGEERELWFGVDSLDEAIDIRGITSRPVLVLGFTPSARLAEAAERGIRLTVYNWETVDALRRFGSSAFIAPLHVHVKVETGMVRQGIVPGEVVRYISELRSMPYVDVEGVATHFATSDETSDGFFQEQLQRFSAVTAQVRGVGMDIPIVHAAATAATLRDPRSHGDLVRIGNGMYGLWPSPQIRALARQRFPTLDLRPVLSWKTIIAQVKRIASGTAVGYGASERLAYDATIAVLPVGYWDGYDRGLSSIGEVLIHGKRCKVVGRICNNMMMVDATVAGHIVPEDEAVLIGSQGQETITVDELAEKLGTINYEVVTRINPLLSRCLA